MCLCSFFHFFTNIITISYQISLVLVNKIKGIISSCYIFLVCFAYLVFSSTRSPFRSLFSIRSRSLIQLIKCHKSLVFHVRFLVRCHTLSNYRIRALHRTRCTHTHTDTCTMDTALCPNRAVEMYTL